MEGRPMVSHSTGSMNSLVGKLTKLTKLKNCPMIIEGLLQVLEKLNMDFLEKVACQREMDGQLKTMLKHVRELVYDIEYWIDLTQADMGESEREQSLEVLKIQILEACDHSRTRYHLDKLNKALTDPLPVDVVPSNVTIESHVLWDEKPGLVAVHEQAKEIVMHLLDQKHEKLKVVSIVGMEGLGKTTLAKEIYAKIANLPETQFKCQAFVTAGQRPSVKVILEDILSQVGPNTGVCFDTINAINKLRGYLDRNRYLIVIDGVWSAHDWEVINCALPDNNNGSRILTTTCIMDVAKSCSILPSDVVYRMKALSKKNSETLFHRSIPVGEAKRQLDDNMVKMCGGMPLALIVAAGLSSRESENLAEPAFKQNFTSEGMTKILHMSYVDLSLPVQSCFLYLSGFTEHYTIKKDRLIRLWVAEGFIPRINEESLWKTGERYFNELISRRLIQPVFNNDDGQVEGYALDGVVLDFAASLSREENFVTTGAELRSGLFQCDTIRRFSLDYNRHEHEAYRLALRRVDLTRVRSFRSFGRHQILCNLSDFKLIRVLDLENHATIHGISHHFGSLVQLIYLGLAGTGTDIKELANNLPSQQTQTIFPHLQTLDLRRTKVKTLPLCMSECQKLVSLLGDGLCFPVDRAYEDMEELSTVDVSETNSRDFLAKVLDSSPRLRMLGVKVCSTSSDHRQVISFLDELRNNNLESLVIDGYGEALYGWVPWPELQRYQLKTPLTRVPRIWEQLVQNLGLTHLDIIMIQTEAVDLLVLGKLPNLMDLKVFSRCYNEYGCTVSRGGFQSLEVAWFICPNDGMGLQFQNRAMPKLRSLRLDFHLAMTRKKYGSEFDFGIQWPSSLAQVHVSINCIGSNRTEVDAVEGAIKEKVTRNPGKPSLVLVKHNESSIDVSEWQLSNTMKPHKIEASASLLAEWSISQG